MVSVGFLDTKLVYDVVVDLRVGSPTYGKWFSVELSSENLRQLMIPKGFAHGYQTLTDRTELFYMVSAFYTPQAELGIRWNDPRFGIEWPIVDDVNISEKDRAWPNFKS